MNIKKLACTAGLALILAVVAAPAYADEWSFEDDDVDAILRPDGEGGYDILTSGTLTTGDVFYSVFEVNIFTIDGTNAIPTGQELTGVAAVVLTGGTGTALDPYTFGVFTDLNAVLDSFGYTGADLPDGTAIAMFLNETSGVGGDINLDVNASSSPGTNCTDVATCSFQATLGDLLQADGFAGDPDEFWVAVVTFPGGDNIATVLDTNAGTEVSAANFGISTLFNSGGTVGPQPLTGSADCTDPEPNGCVQLIGSVSIKGGAGLTGTGFIAHSDFDANKLVTPIPEPATLALMGLGLVGLGVIRMCKKV